MISRCDGLTVSSGRTLRFFIVARGTPSIRGTRVWHFHWHRPIDHLHISSFQDCGILLKFRVSKTPTNDHNPLLQVNDYPTHFFHDTVKSTCYNGDIHVGSALATNVLMPCKGVGSCGGMCTMVRALSTPVSLAAQLPNTGMKASKSFRAICLLSISSTTRV